MWHHKQTKIRVTNCRRYRWKDSPSVLSDSTSFSSANQIRQHAMLSSSFCKTFAQSAQIFKSQQPGNMWNGFLPGNVWSLSPIFLFGGRKVCCNTQPKPKPTKATAATNLRPSDLLCPLCLVKTLPLNEQIIGHMNRLALPSTLMTWSYQINRGERWAHWWLSPSAKERLCVQEKRGREREREGGGEEKRREGR